ncbi:hypothetical protein COU54_01385 [Candidatus Pacearchaeota archaeon CG10_big_fil_rev_8_21_14_0_10_31_24]|nr:MAG: hypothetical protein COU54_01385 [Candidatus Pacearchaeota archaeon CG10_big_fil_rev_8_21_14_0_10_31_24]
MNKEELKKEVMSIPYWYHKIQLPYDIVTPGWAPLDLSRYNLPDSFEGKRVLDVGAWDGFFSFLALERGAKEVVAIDDFSDNLGANNNKTTFDETEKKCILERSNKPWETFDLCKKTLGYTDSQCRRITISLYDITEELLGGKFDIIFFFGTLYHLKMPMYALHKLSNLCTDEMYVESAICDDISPYGKSRTDVPILQFFPGNQYGSNDTNWFVPNISALAHMIHVSGFEYVSAWKLDDNEVTELSRARAFCRALKINPKNNCDMILEK